MSFGTESLKNASQRLLLHACALCVTSSMTLAEPMALEGDDIMIDGQDYRLEGVDKGNQTCRAGDGQAEPRGDEARARLPQSSPASK
jgi:endonuclease YncB( thermonuclease family)